MRNSQLGLRAERLRRRSSQVFTLKAPRSLTLARGGFFPMTFAVFRTCRVCRKFLKQPVALVERTYCRFREPPKAPQVVLYDQYDNASANGHSSQDFEAAFDPFDDQLADDFVVPGGQTWNVESIDADGIPFNCSGSCIPDTFNVFFYTDSGGLPGAQVYSATGQSFVIAGSTYSITLTVPAVLGAGTYWVSVQARMDFTGNGQWGWTDRTVQSNQGAAWQNPGGGFGVCPTWTRKPTCIPTAGGPDQVYRLNGTTGGGGTPSPTPTGTPAGCTNYSFTTGSDPLVPGDTDTGNILRRLRYLCSLPFPVPTFTDQTYNSANVNSNGASISCVSTSQRALRQLVCPRRPMYARWIMTIFPLWMITALM